jgi:rSAM/selenodomain-associated transferase 2
MFKKYLEKQISIIIPVFNEPLISQFIDTLKKTISQDIYEIIVVDIDTKDSIKYIKQKDVIKVISKKGRANQMNEGIKYSTANILLFLHADTLLPSNAIEEIIVILKDTRIVAGAFDLSFDSNKYILKIISTIASWRSRLTRIPYGDQAIFIRKDIFNEVYGYKDIPLMEDVDLMIKLKQKNYKIHISNKKVITSARKWNNKGVFYTTIRNLIL